MESTHLRDVHFGVFVFFGGGLFCLTVNKLITDKTQNIIFFNSITFWLLEIFTKCSLVGAQGQKNEAPSENQTH